MGKGGAGKGIKLTSFFFFFTFYWSIIIIVHLHTPGARIIWGGERAGYSFRKIVIIISVKLVQ